ncbi:MAG: type VI secretion system baseplate subunit TssG [Deltaproteobacteria bacterium]|jgi:type VI secretion system protein ImpH|nr:type VI secretion system baseplate subunit TssG [Deltaproteobacteria bacterium]
MIEELKKDPQGFAYFQALRLLWLSGRERKPSLSEMINQNLIIKCSPDLAFPTADLIAVEERGEDRYNLTVTFMGLVGAVSPLPPFYAREILEDVLNDDYGSSHLIDLITLPSYRHHAAAYFHNKLAFRLLEENDPECWAIVWSLLGLANDEMVAQSEGGDLAFLSLLSTQTRTADGLLAYIKGSLDLDIEELTQCVPRWVAIPPEQRLTLGGDRHHRALGGCCLGQMARDNCGQFNLTIKVTTPELFEGLKPEAPLRRQLEKIVDRFVNAPLVYNLILIFSPGVVPRARLGMGSALGRWACLSPPDQPITLHSPAAGDRGSWMVH